MKYRSDTKAIENAIRTLAAEGQITEVRAFEAVLKGQGRVPRIVFGYFDDPAKLAAAVNSITEAKGIFFTPNPVNPDLFARSANQLRVPVNKGETTSDKLIDRRRFFLVDADPKRLSDISATDEEHEAAITLARSIYAYLRDLGWPDPVAADSGNGAHLLYRVDDRWC